MDFHFRSRISVALKVKSALKSLNFNPQYLVMIHLTCFRATAIDLWPSFWLFTLCVHRRDTGLEPYLTIDLPVLAALALLCFLNHFLHQTGNVLLIRIGLFNESAYCQHRVWGIKHRFKSL